MSNGVNGGGEAAHINNLPIPIGMFMNMSNKPPRFYNQMLQQQRGGGYNNKLPPRFNRGFSQEGGGGSQVTQSQAEGTHRGGPMTQGGSATAGHGSSNTLHSQVNVHYYSS